jgi:hypothetical protein
MKCGVDVSINIHISLTKKQLKFQIFKFSCLRQIHHVFLIINYLNLNKFYYLKKKL